MKAVCEIYKKLSVQIWFVILSLLITVFGILMLTDLKKYYCYYTGYPYRECDLLYDENGTAYYLVYMDIGTGLYYKTRRDKILISELSDNDYILENADLYLDIYYENYESGNNEMTFLKTVKGGKYSQKYYALTFGMGIRIIPRIENVKITYPKRRIYIPIILFIISVPMVGLSTYNTICIIVEKVKLKRESETPVE